MSRMRVVFVDGDEGFLAGVRRALRPRRNEWDIDFFTWPERALEAVAFDAADFVVSEIDVPGMSGLPFLDEVGRRHPETIRVVLTDAGERMGRLRSTGVAHLYLAKPWQADVFERAVARAKALRTDLADSRLVETIAAAETLPEVPQAYAELVEDLAAGVSSLGRVRATVSADRAMTETILRLVNSPYLGLHRPVADIGRAVTVLGIDTIIALVLNAHLHRSASLPLHNGEQIRGLWARSLAVAQLARAIAMIDISTRAFAEETYLAGALSTCGKLVFAANWPDEFVQIEMRGGDVDAERAVFGVDHAAVGAYVLAHRGLPDDVVEAVAYHREPSRCAVEPSPVLAAVHAAQVLDARPDPLTPPEFDMPFLKQTGLRRHIGHWMAVADEITYERQYA